MTRNKPAAPASPKDLEEQQIENKKDAEKEIPKSDFDSDTLTPASESDTRPENLSLWDNVPRTISSAVQSVISVNYSPGAPAGGSISRSPSTSSSKGPKKAKSGNIRCRDCTG
ncbi:hypothetical protein LTR78_008366 [Recurvomyces mirabilis]|uniref:Uncharacterized protein n=1 Tax=Recurvomyces mirabilis TaxID=574656 RepID=A0AAE0WH12_9PEZI|nr:hypothetical protein LTR78_008366 [Recurvomyces mirabilis]